MPKRRRLPPKGADHASTAVSILSEGKRYETEGTSMAPSSPKDETPADPPPRARSDAEGMTRRTYYLTATDADALEETVTQIYTQLNGLTPRHRILGALLSAGVNQRETITSQLRAELLKGLQ